LRFEIGRRLCGEGGIALSDARAIGAMATGARGQSARRIAALVQFGGSAILRIRHTCRAFGHRQSGIVVRQLFTRRPIEMIGNPSHLRMAALALGEVLELPGVVARIEAGEPRGKCTIAFAVQPVTRHTSATRARIAPTQRDDFTRNFVSAGGRFDFRASGKRSQQKEARKSRRRYAHPLGNSPATRQVPTSMRGWT